MKFEISFLGFDIFLPKLHYALNCHNIGFFLEHVPITCEQIPTNILVIVIIANNVTKMELRITVYVDAKPKL